MSFYLFARPSFIEGVARIFDFGHTLAVYNESNSPAQVDYLALASDWQQVGDDLRTSLAEFEREATPGAKTAA